MLGMQRPRLSSVPAYDTTLGPEVIDLCTKAGFNLDPWQRYLLTESLGLRADRKWSAFEICIVVPRQNGKGGYLEALELGGLFLFREQLILHSAHEFKTAEEAFRRVLFWIENTPEFSKRVKKVSTSHGQEGIELLPTPTVIMSSGRNGIIPSINQRLRFIARSKSSGRGFTGDRLIYDEDMILDASAVGATLPSLSARPNPQVVYAGSAGLRGSSQLASIRRRGMSGDSPRLFFAEWSIDWHDEYCAPDCTKHDDPDDIRSVARANPALGIRIDESFIAAERDAMHGAPDEWLRERCGVGQYPAPLDGWLVIAKAWWEATLDRTADVAYRRPVFAVDVQPNRESASIGVAGLRPDGRAGVELADHQPGTRWVVKRCQEMNERWQPAYWVIDPRGAVGSLAADMQKAGLPVKTMVARDVANACGLFFDAVRDDQLRHPDQMALRTALAAADKRKLAESWAWDRVNCAVDISPLVAVTFALWGHLNLPEDDDAEISETVHFDITEIIRLCAMGAYGPDDVARLRASGLLDDKGMEALRNAGIAA